MPFKINYSPRRNLKTPSRFFENAFTFDVKCLYLCCKTNTLAYEIKVGSNTYKSGYYFVVNVEASDDKAIKEFDRLALISQDVVRHLVINKED